MEQYIESAVQQFRTLLEQQIARSQNMEKSAIDFATKEQITIGIIDGDGIGPIIMKESRQVLEYLLKEEIAAGKVVVRQIEGLTIENRLALGQSVPADVLAAIKESKGSNTENIEQALDDINEQDELFYYHALPSLPQGVRESVDSVGPYLAMPALVAICPVIGT